MEKLSWDWSYSSALRNEIPMAPSSWSDGFPNYDSLSGKLELSEALFGSNLELQEIPVIDLMLNQEAIKLAMAGAGNSFVDASLRGEEIATHMSTFPQARGPEELHALPSGVTGDINDGVSAIFSGSENVSKLTSSGIISSGESESYCSVHDEAHSQCIVNRENNKRKLNKASSQIRFEDSSRIKRLKGSPLAATAAASSIDFRQENQYEPDTEAIAQVKEMIYRAATLRPVNLGREKPVEKPTRKNVRISSDPQTVAARHRRERISERLRMLQRLVPGGSKMDTASMLDEAANYLKFLRSQVSSLEAQGKAGGAAIFPAPLVQASNFNMQAIVNLSKPYF